MPPITALLHTRNDGLRLGRALETLLPCAEILIVDHDSADATLRIAREYGARIVFAKSDTPANRYLSLASHDWILCLDPTESITEALQATLFEWILLRTDQVEQRAFSLRVREQTGEIWRNSPCPETRLIPRNWREWNGHLPDSDPSAVTLEGELLRFA
jgi:glycosyltransferase involved in cell wall biosynthesis